MQTKTAMKITHTVDAYLRRAHCLLHHPRNLPDLQEVSFGEDHPDKHFLVIRRYSPSCGGLLSFFMTNLGWIRYAVKNGMIPVIDMQTWLNQCLEISEVGKRNAWEFYFEQPCGYSIGDIKHAKNITIANATLAPENIYLSDLMADKSICTEAKALVNRYIRIKPESLFEYDNPELEKALAANNNAKVIGVRARGTDYNVVRPHGHAVQPTAEDFVKKIAEFPSSFPIYLVSEDLTIVNFMTKTFGSRIILSKQEMPDYHGGWMPDCRTPGKTRKQEGAGYLKAIYDLSRCPILLAGWNNGTAVATLFSKEFETFHLFKLGFYP